LHTIGDTLLNGRIPCFGLVRVLVTRVGWGTSRIEVVIEVDSLLTTLRLMFDPVPDVIEVKGLREHMVRMNASLRVLVNHLLATLTAHRLPRHARCRPLCWQGLGLEPRDGTKHAPHQVISSAPRQVVAPLEPLPNRPGCANLMPE